MSRQIDKQRAQTVRVPAGKTVILKGGPAEYRSGFLLHRKAAVLQTGRQEQGLTGGQHAGPPAQDQAELPLLYDDDHMVVQQALRMDPARFGNNLPR